MNVIYNPTLPVAIKRFEVTRANNEEEMIRVNHEKEMIMRDIEALKLEPKDYTNDYNLTCANYGLEQCNKQCTIGGTNKAEVVAYYRGIQKLATFDRVIRKDGTIHETNHSKEAIELLEFNKLLQQSKRHSALVQKLVSDGELTIDEQNEKATLENAMLGGTCINLAFITRMLILKKYSTRIEAAKLNNHTILVIGRPLNSDRRDIDTWGDAVICDPWANMAYPVSEFRNKQATCKNILVHNDDGTHYLAGNPLIYYPKP